MWDCLHKLPQCTNSLERLSRQYHSVDDVMQALEGIAQCCTSWLADVQCYTEKRGVVQGPEGIISSKTIASIKMMLQWNSWSMSNSMLTLVIEHLFRKMWASNYTPTVLECKWREDPCSNEHNLSSCKKKAWNGKLNFFRLSFCNCLSCVHYCEDLLFIYSSSAVQIYDFVYS